MKKNLLSIVILALLVVNIALTTIMMFTVMKNEQGAGKIITDIASALSLELDKGDGKEEQEVSIKDTEIFEYADDMTISLKSDGSGSTSYCICKVSLSINTKDDGYKDYSANPEKYQTLIQSDILSVVSSYTRDEAQISKEIIEEQILKNIQEKYGTVIYKVSFSKFMFG